VRTRLDELKRQEVSRLRMLLKAKMDSTNLQSMFVYYSNDADKQENLLILFLCLLHLCTQKYFIVIAGVQMDHASLLKQFEHLDPHNQNTFEAKDLELLIATVMPIT